MNGYRKLHTPNFTHKYNTCYTLCEAFCSQIKIYP